MSANSDGALAKLSAEQEELFRWIYERWTDPWEHKGQRIQRLRVQPFGSSGRFRLAQASPDCSHEGEESRLCDELDLRALSRVQLVRIERTSGTKRVVGRKFVELTDKGEELGVRMSGADRPIRSVSERFLATGDEQPVVTISPRAHDWLTKAALQLQASSEKDDLAETTIAQKCFLALQAFAADLIEMSGLDDPASSDEQVKLRLNLVLDQFVQAGWINDTQRTLLKQCLNNTIRLIHSKRHPDAASEWSEESSLESQQIVDFSAIVLYQIALVLAHQASRSS